MTNLPGFSKVGGVTKFSELEIDQSFTENMQQLNQRSLTPNKYQWDLKELTLQSDQEITIDYDVVPGVPLHVIGKPYWNLLYDLESTLPKAQQEFNMNIQEATAGGVSAEVVVMDQNILFNTTQLDDSKSYIYTTHFRENSVSGNGVVLFKRNALSNSHWIEMNDIQPNKHHAMNISAAMINCTTNEINRFSFDQRGVIDGNDILTSGSKGLTSLIGTSTFDEVMGILNQNGTANTYLLNENAKIKIGDNLKVSTEADTTTTGGE